MLWKIPAKSSVKFVSGNELNELKIRLKVKRMDLKVDI